MDVAEDTAAVSTVMFADAQVEFGLTRDIVADGREVIGLCWDRCRISSQVKKV